MNAGTDDLPGVAERGPGPVRRALLGLLLGGAAGVLAAILSPRRERARRTNAGVTRTHAGADEPEGAAATR